MSRYQRFDDYARLNPGMLRHRIILYSRTVGKSTATGADETTYTEPFASNVPAAMNPSGGTEFYAAARFDTEDLQTCMMRYREGVDTSLQLDFDGRRYEIIRVDDLDERKVTLMLALRRIL